MDHNIIQGRSVLGGSATVLTGTLSVGVTTYIDGGVYYGKVSATNTTTTPTLNLNTIGAKTIVNKIGGALTIGQIVASGWYQFQYDSGTDKFLLLNSEVDSGWIDLSGFSHQSSYGNKPQYRLIGKRLELKGQIVVPLSSDGGATLVTLTNEASYKDTTYVAPYTGSGGVSLSGSTIVTFNLGASVIPTASHYPDTTYYSGLVRAQRRVLSDTASRNIVYISLGYFGITSGGVLSFTTIYDAEWVANDAELGTSPYRFLVSNVVPGDYAIDFRDAGGGDTLFGNTITIQIMLF